MDLKRLLAGVGILLSVGVGGAQVKLATVFSDHMVLQRGVELPVWGWAAPGEAVKVTLGAKTLDTKTAANWRW